jgi:PAS domain-containing protein
MLREEGNAKIILETMPIGVIVVDRSGAIQQLNQEARRIWSVGTAALSRDCNDDSGGWPDPGQPIQRDEWAIIRAIDEGDTTLCEIILVNAWTAPRDRFEFRDTPSQSRPNYGSVDIMQDISGQHHVQAGISQVSNIVAEIVHHSLA